MLASTRPARVLSLLLLVVIANAYIVNAAFATTVADSSNAKALLGRLVTNSNRPVIVNGGEAITGAVILSGTQLVTPASAGATVQLDRLGVVSIAPSSTVTLAFDAKSVTVNVAAGYADVSTVDGVKGTVTGVPTAGGTAPTAPAGGNSAKNWGIAGVAVGGGAFIWAIIAWNKANDAEDDAKAAQASAATLASQLAALRTCLAGQTTSPLKLCTSF
ncbi:MAG TPA: hypothetical protein VHQ64_17420 [Pyrinomonadaceae bacterium]|nr:hypothetical protein [Pyrinomonadaceae bacterium]